jgi:TP901 family phage tail tape measure protein
LALKARDDASAVLERADAALAGLNRKALDVRGSLSGVGATLKTIGLIGAGVFIAILSFFGMAETAAVGFQSALTDVRVTAALTEVQTDNLGVALQKAALGTRASATDMAKALSPVAGEFKRLEGGVWDTADAVKLMTAAQNLAESSDTSLGASTKTLTNLLLVYHLKASDAASVSDTLFQAHAQLGMGVDQLAATLQRLQPRIAGSGLSLQQMLGIVREITPTVGSGSRALLQVGTILQQLQTPSAGAAKELAALHIKLTDSKGVFIGYGAEIDKIKTAYDKLHTATSKAALLQAIFGHSAAIGKVLIEGGSAAIAQNTQALAANGTAQDATAAKMSDAQSQMDMLPKTLGDISLAIGMVLLPPLNRLLTAVMPIVLQLADWATNNPLLATTILAVAAGVAALSAVFAFAGPILAMVGAVTGLLTSPIVLIGVGVAALVVFMSQVPSVAGPFKDVLTSLWSGLTGLLGPIKEVGTAILNVFKGKGSTDQIGVAFGNLGAAVWKLLQDLWPKFVKLGEAFVGWLLPQIPKLLKQLSTWAGQIVTWLVDHAPEIAAGVGEAIKTAFGVAGQLEQSLENLMSGAGNWLADTGIPQLTAVIGQAFDRFAQWLPNHIPELLEDIVGALALLGKNMTGPINALIQPILRKLPGWVADALGWVLARLGNMAGSIGRAIYDFFFPGESMNDLKAAIHNVIGFFIGIPGNIADALSGLAKILQKYIAGPFEGIPGNIADALSGLAKDIDTSVVHPIEDGFNGIIRFLIGLPAKIVVVSQGMWDGITTAFKSSINTIIDGWNKLKFGIPGFDLGPVHYGGFNLTMPPIKRLDVGAWNLASDMLAMVHKGEMVVPAAPAAQLRNTWAGGAQPSGSGNTTHIIQVMLDGKQVAETVDRHQGTRFLLSGSSKMRPSGA